MEGGAGESGQSFPDPAACVRVIVELTEQDVAEGFASIPERRYSMIVVVMIGIAAAVYAWSGSGGGIAALIIAVALGFGLWWGMRIGVRRTARRAMSTMSVQGGIEYTFTPDFVEIRTAKANTQIQYDGLYRYLFTQTTLLLYTSNQVAQIVPLRAFDAAELAKVQGWLQANVKQAAKVPRGLVRVLALWALLIIAFLAIWMFLAPERETGRGDSGPSDVPSDPRD